MRIVQFRGVVHHGQARGRVLGFPTANLKVESPIDKEFHRGVYVGLVQWEGGPQFGTLINFGVRPTFAEGELSIELHILDFSGNLYGKTLDVTVVQRLRDEQRFEGVDALIKQIELDIKQARSVLQEGAGLS